MEASLGSRGLRPAGFRKVLRWPHSIHNSRRHQTGTLDVHYLGQWQTPWWEDGVDKGPKTRAGFVAKTSINRQDFGVSWNDIMDKGGIVVSNTIEITIDAEAIFEGE